MKTLVIGAAGGFGGTVARELQRRGMPLAALVRPGGRRPALRGATLVEGDALDRSAVARAARGMDAIVWGFHVPYPEWVPTAVRAAEVTADVARETGATVLFPGNLYGLGAGHPGPMKESAALRPRSRLGEIRNEIESIFERATHGGAKVVVVRAGDYLGPDAANTWFEMMTRWALGGGRLLDPGAPGVPHAWAYLPDVAKAGVDLLERRSSLSPFDVFHFEGFSIESAAMLSAIRTALGDPQRRTMRFPWWAVRAASLFSPLLRLALSMRYLWEEPVILDGGKLRAALPDFRAASLDEAVTRTLSALAERHGAPLKVLPAPV